MSMKIICEFCTQEIKDRVFVNLDSNVYFHTAHFRCSVCEANLSEKPYYKKSKKFYCEDDYHKTFSPCCELCKNPIKDQYITALGKPFHIEHFNCMKCQGKFVDDKFYKVDSKAFCRNCYQNFASICFCCQKFIIEKAVSLFGKIYHRSCLKCAKCENNDFQDDFYFEHQDEIYHENCYKESLYEKCCLCKNHCDAEFIRIENKPFHQQCLDLYRDYAKKMIEEELNGKEENENNEIESQNSNPSSKEKTPDHKDENNQINPNNHDNQNGQNDSDNRNNDKKNDSNIKKSSELSKYNKHEESFKIFESSNQNGKNIEKNENELDTHLVSNRLTYMKKGSKVKFEEEGNEIVLSKDMTSRIETKIRNSIKLIEIDIKNIEIIHKKVSVIAGRPTLVKSNEKKNRESAKSHYHSISILRNGPFPPEIDITKRESYLSDDDFESQFRMKKSQFYSMLRWRQVDLKKKLGFF